MIRPFGDRGSREGYILVAVLSVMLLLTGFMAAGSLLVRSALDTVRVGDADVAMIGLTQGGMELTAYQLFVIQAAPDAIDGRRIRFGGGTIAPHVTDESGKADLNASDPKLLAGVFESVGVGSGDAGDLVAHIVALRGADRNPQPGAPGLAAAAPTSAGSGEAGASQTPTPSAATTASPASGQKKLRGFQSVDQLADFPGLAREDLVALRPMLTVYNPDGKINILSASRDVLAAIPGMSGAEVATIVEQRKTADKDGIDRLKALIKGAETYIKTDYGPAFTVRIDATAPTGRRKSINAVVAASKSRNDPYLVLDWWE